MSTRFRANLLIVLSFLAYLFALGGVIYTMDYIHLRLEKAEYVFQNKWTYLGIDAEKLGALATRILVPPREGRDPEEEERRIADGIEQMREYMETVVHGDNPAYYIALYGQSGNLLVSAKNSAKPWARRHWNNTAILNFSHGYTISPPSEIGRFNIKFTNPENDPRIAEITRKHQIRIYSAIAALTLVFALLTRYILLPIRNVTAALRPEEVGPPSLLPRQRSGLESSYNQIATDALLTRLDEATRAIPDRGDSYERFEAQHRLCRALAELFDYSPVWILARDVDGEKFSLRGGWPTEADSAFNVIASLNQTDLAEALDAPADAPAAGPIVLDLKAPGGQTLRALAAPLLPIEPGEKESNVLVAVCAHGRDRATPSAFARRLFSRVAEQTRRSLLDRHNRRKRMARERSEANINIARHLGHDLTNIIATSKLDLIAVQNFLKSERDDAPPVSPRRRIFFESLEALLKNTRFLQEIVNLYRSFGYVRHPKYEWVDINDLVSHMAELFSYSTSAHVSIETRLCPTPPRAVVEPRLLRLSLFNLMTNAIEAIYAKDDGATEGEPEAAAPAASDRVVLSTETIDDGEDGPTLRLSIRDTGAGIRGRDGELLAPDDLRGILHLGITTKDEEGSEGLGLDWVRTIIEDFHQGHIEPRNLAEGGAEFVLDIPVESPERPIRPSEEPTE